MLLLKPSGAWPVGIRDLQFASVSPRPPGGYSADNHVVARLFYPAAAPASASSSSGGGGKWLPWLPSNGWTFADGYVSWGFRNPSTLKERGMKLAARSLLYVLGMSRRLRGTYDAPVADPPTGNGSSSNGSSSNNGSSSSSGWPVVVFSHGAASCRNTCSILATELASRGFVVAAVEHSDGTACCVRQADGSYMLLQGLGTGDELEAKCAYRVEECCTLARALQALHDGARVPGLRLSGCGCGGGEPGGSGGEAGANGGASGEKSGQQARKAPAGGTDGGQHHPPPQQMQQQQLGQQQQQQQPFRGRLDLGRLALVGHSCGGATAACAAAEHAEFKAGVALDPWWPLLPKDSAALTGWRTGSALLVVSSAAWSKPEARFYGAERQAAVFAAARPKTATGSNGGGDSAAAQGGEAGTAAAAGASRPLVGAVAGVVGAAATSTTTTPAAATAATAPATAAAVVGGGALHIVPTASVHGTFTDLPFLFHPLLDAALRRAARLKAAEKARVPPAAVFGGVVWAVHAFLSDHLPLPAAHPSSLAAHERHLLAAAAAARGSGGRFDNSAPPPAGVGGAGAAAAGPAAAERQGGGGSGVAQPPVAPLTAAVAAAGGLPDELADHLAADEPAIAADEAAEAARRRSLGAAATAAAQPPPPYAAHTVHDAAAHDTALEDAAAPRLAAAAAAPHVPVRPSERERYAAALGELAELVAVHTR